MRPGPSLYLGGESPYLYSSTTANGRVLGGGDDADIADAARRDALLPRKAAWLQRRLAALLPQVDARVDFRGAVRSAHRPTHCPPSARCRASRNCYAVLGYGGNGITFSMLAAQMLRNLLTGDHEPDLDLVIPRRR